MVQSPVLEIAPLLSQRVPQFHGCVDAAMVLEHEGQYSFHGPTPLHEQVNRVGAAHRPYVRTE